MAASRYTSIQQSWWQYMNPAIRGLDRDLAAVEAAGTSGGGVRAWTAWTPYTAGAVVAYANALYQARATFTSAAVFDPTQWDVLVAPGTSQLAAYENGDGTVSYR